MKKIFFLVLIICAGFLSFQCSKEGSKATCDIEPTPVERINGVNWVGVSEQIPASDFEEVKRVDAEWVSLIPYSFIQDGSSTVQYGATWQWFGETREGIKEHIQFAHGAGLKVMVKPHVWINGQYTGTYSLSTEEEWVELETTLKTYIMDFVTLAVEENVELFCIGTEWKTFVAERPAFWGELIDEIKLTYTGELTYAGNWDAYDDFPHWDKLDYIGVDAYFPVSEESTPTVQSCIDGWQPHKAAMKALSDQFNKDVLFTEYGYRSIDFTGKEPWVSSNNTTFNMEAQKNAFEGLYKVFYSEDWMKGGFIWKWYPDYASSGGASDNRFTPQNKTVESVIKQYY